MKRSCSKAPNDLDFDAGGNPFLIDPWATGPGLGMADRIPGVVPIPNGDLSTTDFAFGGPDNKTIYFIGANSGAFRRPVPV